MAGTAMKGTAKNWYDKYSFHIVIDGIVRAAFNKCTGLKAEADVIEYAEGGALTPDKSPGLVKFEDVTLSRGESRDDSLFNWWKEIHDVTGNIKNANTAGSGAVSATKQVTIVQTLRDGTSVRKWPLTKAWPKGFELDDWDNTSSEKHIESLVLAHQGFDIANV